MYDEGHRDTFRFRYNETHVFFFFAIDAFSRERRDVVENKNNIRDFIGNIAHFIYGCCA
jgi:hypothetical protein